MLTIRELIKTLYNAFNQKLKSQIKNSRGNWEQNDPTADDYIKNRPFYVDENKVIKIIPKQTITLSESIGYANISLSPIIELVIGQEYDVVWDEMKYKCTAYEFDGVAVIGSNFMMNGSFDNEPFFIAISKEMFGGACIATGDTNSHVVEVTTKDIKKIDKKYLPDMGLDVDLAPVATSGDYWDLENIPETYSDVVRYGASQSLSDMQKNQARNNIGAVDASYVNSSVVGLVKYNTSQNLTDEQKEVARNNIGAGTSSFSGSYNDLTDMPELKYNNLSMKPVGLEYDASAGYIYEGTGYNSEKAKALFEYLIPGNNYYAEFNGESHFVTAKLYQPLSGDIYHYIGNISLNNSNFPNSGEDWYIIAVDKSDNTSYGLFMSFENEVTHRPFRTISLEEIVINQLDEVYIPNTIARTDTTIPTPSTAQVGQTIMVKSIDENGKPTEWEAVDIVTEARVNELITAALAAIPNAEEASF